MEKKKIELMCVFSGRFQKLLYLKLAVAVHEIVFTHWVFIGKYFLTAYRLSTALLARLVMEFFISSQQLDIKDLKHR